MTSLTVAAAMPVAAASKGEATVVVRTYDYANVSSDQLAAARAEAEQIFRSARIAVQWIDCRVPGRLDGAACTEPLSPGRDLMLRIVDKTPANVDGAERVVALGESMVDRDERGGVLMTVDLFPVRAIAQRASTGMPGTARTRDRARNWTPPAREPRTPPARPDAGTVVARGTARPEARKLGLFIPGGRPNAANPARTVANGRLAAPIAPIAPIAPNAPSDILPLWRTP